MDVPLVVEIIGSAAGVVAAVAGVFALRRRQSGEPRAVMGELEMLLEQMKGRVQVAEQMAKPLEAAIKGLRESPDPQAAVRQAMSASPVLTLGLPAGEVTPMGGSEADLLHFSADDDNGVEREFLPVFTSAEALKTALHRNLEWWPLNVLVNNGGELLRKIEGQVTVIVDPWTDLEFTLAPRDSSL